MAILFNCLFIISVIQIKEGEKKVMRIYKVKGNDTYYYSGMDKKYMKIYINDLFNSLYYYDNHIIDKAYYTGSSKYDYNIIFSKRIICNDIVLLIGRRYPKTINKQSSWCEYNMLYDILIIKIGSRSIKRRRKEVR